MLSGGDSVSPPLGDVSFSLVDSVALAGGCTVSVGVIGGVSGIVISGATLLVGGIVGVIGVG